MRLYGRTHEKEDFPDPFDEIYIPISFVKHDRVRQEFKMDALHHKIRDEKKTIEVLRQEYLEEIKENKIPSLDNHAQSVITASILNITLLY